MYRLHGILGPDDGQDVVCKEALGLIESVVDGNSAALIMYGAQGSGKSYTALGKFLKCCHFTHSELMLPLSNIYTFHTILWTPCTLLGNQSSGRCCVGLMSPFHAACRHFCCLHRPNAVHKSWAYAMMMNIHPCNPDRFAI
eukprot:scaffold91754_cov31-Prasinocladus_malaysianus.AAC.1